MKAWRLRIRLAASEDFEPGNATPLEVRGGPMALLRWLENQLGIPEQKLATPHRILRAWKLLQEASVMPSVHQPYGWVLERIRARDRFRMEHPDAESPWPWLHVLDQAQGGEPDRWGAVLQALEVAELPAHDVEILEPLDAWPALPRRVLQGLNHHLAPVAVPQLFLSQAAEPSDAARRIPLDGEWVVSGSLKPVETELRRRGVPLAPPERIDEDHPGRMVLPLLLRLSFRPADPYDLHDLLAMPGGPVGPKLGKDLARALDRAPSMESPTWNRAVEQALRDDPDRVFLKHWLPLLGQEESVLTLEQVQERMGMIFEWATERYKDRQPVRRALGEMMEIVLALTEMHGGWRRDDQEGHLARVLAGFGQGAIPLSVQSTRVTSSLAHAGHAKVWVLGTAGLHVRSRPHSALEVELREAAGVPVWRNSLAQEQELQDRLWGQFEEIHVIQLSGDSIPSNLQQAQEDAMPSVEGPERTPVEWGITSTQLAVKRSLQPEVVRASSVQAMMTCPRKWVFEHVLALDMGRSKSLSTPPQLKGNLVHRVLERTLRDHLEACPSLEDLEGLFHEEAALMGRPLLRDEHRDQLRELVGPTHRTLERLYTMHPQKVRTEFSVEGNLGSLRFRGQVDVELETPTGRVLLDYKSSASQKDPALIRAGIAAQPFLYQQATGASASGYLMTATGDLAFASEWRLPAGSYPEKGSGKQWFEQERSLEEYILGVWDQLGRGQLLASPRMRTGSAKAPGELFEPTEIGQAARAHRQVHLRFGTSDDPCSVCDFVELCGKEVEA